MFGDIVKVTPTSKAVGDMALFMVTNNLSVQDVMNADRDLAPPASVIDLLSGMMGQPPGGFPEPVLQAVLRDRPRVNGRPGQSLPPADIEATRAKVSELLGTPANEHQCITHILYPKVYEEFIANRKKYGDLSILPTPEFLYGPDMSQELSVDIEPGKRLIIRFLAVGQPKPDSTRTVFFELNGQPREIEVVDRSLDNPVVQAIKADPTDATHVSANMPGMVISIAVKEGQEVKKGEKLVVLEAMKMETTIQANHDGIVKQILVKTGTPVDTGDLVMVVD
jgi:pyruvate carboxylase